MLGTSNAKMLPSDPSERAFFPNRRPLPEAAVMLPEPLPTAEQFAVIGRNDLDQPIYEFPYTRHIR